MNKSDMFEAVSSYIDKHYQEYLDQLIRFCSQPSISAQKLGIMEMLELLIKEMNAIGMQTKILPTAGNPALFAEMEGRGNEILLFYNHYDVQPPEPFEAWITAPFEPKIRDGRLYGRGTTDNKGNIVARISAVRAIAKSIGFLPTSIKFLIDGEEEIGSPSLLEVFEGNKELLSCTWILWEDTLREGDTPVISLGSKALCYLEMKCKTASADFHSAWAGVYPNAAWRLVSALSTMKDADGRILIDGFYDDVRSFSGKERVLLEQQPEVDVRRIKESFQIQRFERNVGSGGFRAQYVSQPTCNISGIISGYTGKGIKTVIPSEAIVKIDMRLVPNQDPTSICRKVRAHLKSRGFSDIEVSSISPASKAFISPIDQHVLKHLRESIQEISGYEAIVEPLSSGATPMWMTDILGKPVLAYGLGHPSSNTHAPNENVEIGAFINQIKIIARMLLSL